jgi:MFS family permease
MGWAPGRAKFRSVLAVPEFRALWAAELFSVAGDQLARVALAVIVFTRTNSAGLTAITYALTFAPAFLGGVLLGGLGDRYPRRAVMAASDLARAVLVALMALPGMPLGVLCFLVATMTFIGGPFKAAQQALLPDVFAGDRTKYTMGQSLRTATSQTAQLVGFAGGGVLVAVLDPTVGLLLDSGTFLISAAVVRIGVKPRAAAAGDRRPSTAVAFTTFARLVWRDPVLRTSFALVWLAGFYITPEALAAPYAAALGLGPGAVGLLMASDPAGSVVGGIVWGKWVPNQVQDRIVGVLGVLAGLPLILCLLRPGLVGSMVLFAVMGMLVTAYLIQAVAAFTLRVPVEQRAQGSGLISSGLLTAQGLGALGAGLLADWIGPIAAMVAAGVAGTIVAVPIAATWRRGS